MQKFQNVPITSGTTTYSGLIGAFQSPERTYLEYVDGSIMTDGYFSDASGFRFHLYIKSWTVLWIWQFFSFRKTRQAFLEFYFDCIDSRTLFGTVYGGGAPSKCFMINDGGNIIGCTRANVLCEKSLILDGRMCLNRTGNPLLLNATSKINFPQHFSARSCIEYCRGLDPTFQVSSNLCCSFFFHFKN